MARKKVNPKKAKMLKKKAKSKGKIGKKKAFAAAD